MNASELLCIVPEHGTLSFQAKKDSSMEFFGASLPVPAKIGGFYNTLVICPDPTKSDLIAIKFTETQIFQGKLSGQKTYGFLIVIEHGMLGSKTVSEFIPSPDRIGSIDTAGRITVLIDGRIYWWKEFAEKHDGDLSGFVSDPNLLCRFMAGKATPEEVNAASIGFAEERQARKEIPAIKETLERLHTENEQLKESVANKMVSKILYDEVVLQNEYFRNCRLEDAKKIDDLNSKVRALENDKINLNDQINKQLRTLQLITHHLQGRMPRWFTPVAVLKIVSEHADELKFFRESGQGLKS